MESKARDPTARIVNGWDFMISRSKAWGRALCQYRISRGSMGAAFRPAWGGLGFDSSAERVFSKPVQPVPWGFQLSGIRPQSPQYSSKGGVDSGRAKTAIQFRS